MGRLLGARWAARGESEDDVNAVLGSMVDDVHVWSRGGRDASDASMLREEWLVLWAHGGVRWAVGGGR